MALVYSMIMWKTKHLSKRGVWGWGEGEDSGGEGLKEGQNLWTAARANF